MTGYGIEVQTIDEIIHEEDANNTVQQRGMWQAALSLNGW